VNPIRIAGSSNRPSPLHESDLPMNPADLAIIRLALRQEANSPGIIAGITMVAKEDEALGFALMCEAVYVHMYQQRGLDEITAYLAGPLRVVNVGDRNSLLATALRIRAALVKADGDHDAAFRDVLSDQGAEKEVVQKIIEACIRTSREYRIPWSKTYFPDFRPAAPSSSAVGCIILAIIVAAIIYGVYRLIRHFTG
jgi:hypothetical protein